MQVHNFHVDYRNTLLDGERDNVIDRFIFVEDMYDNGVFNLIVCNENNSREGGMPNKKEQQSRLNGMKIRDELRDELKKYNMKGSDKSKWNYDAVNHIQCN